MQNWSLLDFLVAGASAVVILGAVYGVGRWGREFADQIHRRLTRFMPTFPRQTIRAVPAKRNWWHLGSRGGQPAMQIATYWLVTNIADRPTMVTKATMTRGWFRKKHDASHLFREAIPVGAAIEVMIDFWIRPPFRKRGESFEARLVLIDNLGNPHNTESFVVPSDWRPKREEPKPAEEPIHAIGDPVVKQVVAILKDEVNRYKECGRPVGGLGSVQVTYENRTLKGIGYQGRRANSPQRQWIVPDPETALISSDNLDALMAIFDKQDDSGKQIITEALLQRIESGTEYTPIGYFFLLSLFRMGQLPAALRAIREKLADDQKYGFDDGVRMLSGLLQYEHPNFDDPMLDQVELFMEGLAGPAHHLKERCVAARAAKTEDTGASRPPSN